MNSFYKRAFKLALPIAMHSLIISAINMADVFMIGQLGETSIAALGISNQLMFMLILFLFGVSSGGQIFIAQFFGKKDKENQDRVVGIMLLPALTISIIAMIGATLFPKFIMSVFSNDETVLSQSATYLMIVGLSYPLTAVAFIFNTVCRSTDRPNFPMYTSFATLLINIFLNWALIFGNLGFPQLGIKGAAIATFTARSIETILTLVLIYSSNSKAAAKFRNMFDFRANLVRKVIKTSLPVFINEITWASGILALNIVFARLGTQAIATINIMDSVGRLSFAAFIGIAHAGGVMLGQDMGAGKMDKVWDDSRKFSFLAVGIGIVIALGLALFAPTIVSIYSISQTVFDYAVKTIYAWAFILPLVAFNCLNIVGILRSGGDTKAALWIDIGALWAVGVPLAIIGAYYLGLPIYLVYLMAKVEEVFKFIFGTHRYISRKWIRNLVEEF